MVRSTQIQRIFNYGWGRFQTKITFHFPTQCRILVVLLASIFCPIFKATSQQTPASINSSQIAYPEFTSPYQAQGYVDKLVMKEYSKKYPGENLFKVFLDLNKKIPSPSERMMATMRFGGPMQGGKANMEVEFETNFSKKKIRGTLVSVMRTGEFKIQKIKAGLKSQSLTVNDKESTYKLKDIKKEYHYLISHNVTLDNYLLAS